MKGDSGLQLDNEGQKNSSLPRFTSLRLWYHEEKEKLEGKKNKFLSWFQPIHIHIFIQVFLAKKIETFLT